MFLEERLRSCPGILGRFRPVDGRIAVPEECMRRAGIGLEELFEPDDGFDVEVVCGLDH